MFMKAASLSEIKQALKERDVPELMDLCLRLARFKKENKELLTYLLFEGQDEANYIRQVKEEMDEGFSEVNTNQVYFAKKTIRKILRGANKHIRYTQSKTAEIEILLHFCTNFRGLRLNLKKSPQLANLYAGQIKKIRAALTTLHEDLQYDYSRDLGRLE